MNEVVIASSKIAEKGQLVLITMYVFEPTPELGPGKGTFHLGTSLTIKVDGKPFMDQDILITKREGVATWEGVDGCQFFDILGSDNRQGKLIEVDFTERIKLA